jgi:hypothetical protein
MGQLELALGAVPTRAGGTSMTRIDFAFSPYPKTRAANKGQCS